MKSRALSLVVFALAFSSVVFGQANGKLQIHFREVGQGDRALLTSPNDETIFFDDGLGDNYGKPLSYLQPYGVIEIDYHTTSHYHSDHIGCASQVLLEFPLQKIAYDRGFSYPSATFDSYVARVGSKRPIATTLTVFTLDASSSKTGNDSDPKSGFDIVGRNIIVEIALIASSFTGIYNDTHVDTYPFWGASSISPSTGSTKYAWSKKSQIYHYAACKYVQNISSANLEMGDTPPSGKTLHNGCPK